MVSPSASDNRFSSANVFASFAARGRRFAVLPAAPAPLAGDDLVMVRRTAQRAHDDRLDDAAFADRCRELVELDLGIGLPRIARIGPQELHRHAPLAAYALDRRGLLADVADQRR